MSFFQLGMKRENLFRFRSYLHLLVNKSSSSTQYRLLHGTGLRSQHPHRHPVLGVILDSRGRHSCPNFLGCVDCAHHNNTEFRYPLFLATSVLREGYRRVELRLSLVRLLRSVRVCLHQRTNTAASQVGIQGHPVNGSKRMSHVFTFIKGPSLTKKTI